MIKATVNYKEHWSKDGTHYNQTINITETNYKEIIKKLNRSKQGGYLHKDIRISWRIAFLNLTQRDFFAKYLDTRKLLNRNTCIYIKLEHKYKT